MSGIPCSRGFVRKGVWLLPTSVYRARECMEHNTRFYTRSGSGKMSLLSTRQGCPFYTKVPAHEGRVFSEYPTAVEVCSPVPSP